LKLKLDLQLIFLIEIIKAAGDGNNLDTLLRIDRSKLTDDCYDKALKAAVEKCRHTNAEKLIVVGARNIDEAMELAKQIDIKLMLIMVKTVLNNDHQLIMEIKNISKGNNQPSKQSDEILSHSEDADHARNPKYDIYSHEMVEYITNGKLRTRVPIKLAIMQNKVDKILDELLLLTNISIANGSVGWSNLSLTELDIKWISNLSQLMVIKQLNLSKNQLSVLPIRIASYLRKCTRLHLQRNNMDSIPAEILELPLIKELNLSQNKISQLPNVSWSASLTQIDLSHNELKTLPDCATEHCSGSITELRLDYNQLKTVPKCVCFLHNLNSLDVSYNPDILVLPVNLGQLANLENLTLKGLHQLYDPPPNICKNSATCISYLRNQFRNKSKYYRMQLMLVGKQNVGKTTMVRCLQGEQYTECSKVGVDIDEWSYNPSFKPTFFFSVWDFAGLEEYYATHQVFLSKRSLYLAVWNVMEGKEGIAELKSWLNNIILQAPKSRIVIVATHLDVLIAEVGREQADIKCNEYRQHFIQNIQNNIFENNVAKVMFVGLKGKHENVSTLKEEIYNAAEDCTDDGHPIMGSSIPASYKLVDNKLSKLSTPILHAVEFKKMVRNLGQPDLQSDVEIKTLTLFLHNIGSLLHFDDHRHNLDDLYFVKPKWLCKLISTVITVKGRNQYVKNGRISKANFKRLFEQANKDYFEKFLNQCLALFNHFKIALPLDKEGDSLLIPCLLPSERPAIDDALSGEFHYQRQFVFCDVITPPGLWSRLLSQFMNNVTKVRDLLDQNDNQNGELLYWDEGLYYHTGNSLFVIESYLSQGISIIYSFNTAQEGLLGELVNLVQQVVSEWYPGLQFEEKFCCYECIKDKQKSIFKLEKLLNYIATNKPFICEVCHTDLDLKVLAPDLLLDDMDPNCILDINDIRVNKNVILGGRFATVHQGDLRSETPVIIKKYGTSEDDSQVKNYETQF